MLKGLLLDLVFPPRCAGCGHTGHFVCPECISSLPWISPPVCPRCGKPQPREALCPSCWGWYPAIEGIRAPFRFEGTIRQAVHSLKYRSIRALAQPLSELLARYYGLATIPADVLVPVPLHRNRLRERGYNQSALLARGLGRTIGLPVIENVLVRQRDTPPQARSTSVEERAQNVAGAFSCGGNAFSGKRVLLIDDVCTTGATLDACAAAVRKAGATSVWGLTLARESKGGNDATCTT
ncbi:MAG: ComF family protein [Chloroflexi bacterium]|nr:ComF family protein [Chloroflexota bacterium]